MTRSVAINVLAVACAAAGGQVSLRVVAVSGDRAPGASQGARFDRFVTPTINNAGDVTFFAFLRDTGNDLGLGESVWTEAGGIALTKVAQSGDTPPDIPGDVQFHGFAVTRAPHSNVRGDVALFADLRGADAPAGTRDAVFFGPAGDQRLLARDGQQAPGLAAGITFNVASGRGPAIAMNSSGTTAMVLGIDNASGPGSFDSSIWRFVEGASPELIARTGTVVANVDPGSEFDALSGVRIRESNGSVLFRGDLGGPNINPFLDTGLFASRGVGLPENIVPIGGAFSGNMAYDITNGTIFTDIGFFQGGGFSLSSSIDPLLGGFGFTAELVGPGISLDDERSIGVVGREIARSGTQAPGLESGMRFAFFDAPPRIDLEGRAAFSADMQTLSDPDTFIDSVWLDTHGTLLPIAVGGRPAPGTADGVTFATGFQTLSPPAINGTGQLAFRGTVEGPGVTDANDRGFWATNDNGELVLALREGDVIDINPQPNITINRTISSLGGFAIDDGGRARSFNDLGQLALNVSFTDGTEAIIVATIETPCSPVDLSAPFGVISNADVSAFVNRFFADDPLVAALASPFDVVSNTDVDEFVRLFFEGCPAE